MTAAIIANNAPQCLNGERPIYDRTLWIGQIPDGPVSRARYDRPGRVTLTINAKQHTRAHRWHGDPTATEIPECVSLSFTCSWPGNGGGYVHAGTFTPDTLPDLYLAPGVSRAMIEEIGRIAEYWHLNDMIAPCAHMRAWWEEAHKTTKYPDRVPLLVCPECAYRTGSAWTAEAVPAAVLDTIAAWSGEKFPHELIHEQETRSAQFLYTYGPSRPPIALPQPPAGIVAVDVEQEPSEHYAIRLDAWQSADGRRRVIFRCYKDGATIELFTTEEDAEKYPPRRSVDKLTGDDAAALAVAWLLPIAE